MELCERITELLYICFNESSIHGLKLIVRQPRLLVERLFWVFCVIFSILFTVLLCYGQWSRFENVPVVLSLETNGRTWKFQSTLGVTICSNYTDRQMARKIVKRTWNIDRNDSRFEYYEQFILTISTAKYYNLEMFANFINDKTLDGVDFLQVAYEMRKELHIPPSLEYSNIITEMGVCHSTTNLDFIQRPYRGNMSDPLVPERVPDDTMYSAVDVMRIIILPHFLDIGNVTIYIHNKNDVINGARTVHENLIESIDVIHNDVELHEILSTEALRGLSIKRRKCLFLDEHVLRFFPIYTENLCGIDCRIQAALLSCGCVPFFYNLNSTQPSCNATGLHCLSKSDWYSKECNCYPLCNSIQFIHIYSEKVFYSVYSRFMEVTVKFPKSRIKRQIIFSVYELIVSFGGGAAFFLGCSFLSFVEIGFYICEWFGSVMRKCTRRRIPLNKPITEHFYAYTN